jgi:hypothetical protein
LAQRVEAHFAIDDLPEEAFAMVRAKRDEIGPGGEQENKWEAVR